jgi:ribosome maturation factor RimP
MDEARTNSHERSVAVADAGKLLSSPVVALVERTVEGLGYELLSLERGAGGLLRVTLDIAPVESESPSPAGGVRQVSIDDCERVSRQLTHLFAVEGIDYDRLEVSSPGLDRPLRGARDFARFAGAMATVQLAAPVGGKRRLRGRLLGLATGEGLPERVRMTLVPAPQPSPRGTRKSRGRALQVGETVEFPLADVQKARLAPEWEFDRGAMQRAAQLPKQ